MRPQRHRSQRLSIFITALTALAVGCNDGGGHHDGEGGAAGVGGEGGVSGQGTSGEGAAGGGAVGGMGLVPEQPGEFVSADAFAGQVVPDYANGAGGMGGGAGGAGGAGGGGAAPPGAGDPRTVVEGDIYRVLDAGTLLNLNSYRGLQVIDVSDPSEPAIIGRLGIIGTPLEMYVRGTTAFVLLNNWQGYYGSRDDIAVQQKQGGLLVSVDISDHQAPRELDRMFVDGNIRTSRVAQNDAVAALYIASSKETAPTSESGSWVTQTIVTSVDISGTQLIKKSELDLGGYVTDIQATPTELLVAGTDYTSGTTAYTVGVVDISDPAGLMVLGDTVPVRGYVQDQFNMDLYNGVLRVVSQSWLSGGNGVETFDAHDLGNITPLHACEFGAGQQLYATLFLGNKAFFVTYFRSDPFHAFSIGDDGACVERNEFIVSGWNDFLRPVAAGTRLIGVGSNDADTIPRPAVSLYDITDLDNANPLLARAEVESVASEWSEAQSDHRAFSVIEGAVSVLAADGTEETGLVLLPYQGYQYEGSPDGSVRRMGVALFTFSGSTVTQRGTLLHDSAVRRSFTTDSDTIANLSETRLSLYDHSDPNAPEALGSVELAPDYMRVLRFGEHVARVKRTSPGYDGGSTGSQGLRDVVEVVPVAVDLNTAAPIAAFEIPAGARLVKAGDLLVTVVQPFEYTTSGDTIFTTQVAIHDLSDPTAPRAAGTAQTTDLMPTYFGYYGYGYPGYYGGGFVGCGMGMGWFDGSQADGVFALGDKIVFVDARGETAPLGTRRTCELYTSNYCEGGDCQDILQGYITCSSLSGGAEVCENHLVRCDLDDGEATCEPVPLDEARPLTADSCWEQEVQRVWSRYAFKALDVSDPDAPVFGGLVEMPRTEQGVSVLPDGDSLYYTYRVPVTVEDDDRPHVSYYFKHITFDDVQAPGVAARVNVPGELIAVSGSSLYTKDLRWGERSADTYLHELSIASSQASIESSRSFIDRDVTKVVVEGDRLYAVHSDASREYGYYYGDYTTKPVKLALLGGDGLTLDAELDIDSWATLEAVHDERALFTVSGGLLMMNVEDASAPYAQAFFHSNGWPEQILFQDGEVLISAGMYGIHRFDADDANLLSDD
jgi:hypothetical protein